MPPKCNFTKKGIIEDALIIVRRQAAAGLGGKGHGEEAKGFVSG